MRLYRLQFEQNLPLSPDEAWSFFSSPRNLPVITPPSLGFEITSDVPEKMHAGMIVTYKVRPFPGVKVNWVTEITHVREPHFFVDEQRFGPYRFWHHQHHFEEAEGGVKMTDIVHYALPFGVFGQIAQPLLVEKQLDSIFSFRYHALEERFGKP